ncbi:palmitoyltransferase ZDHHC6-like protein, partial [Euroglyphus maynei]
YEQIQQKKDKIDNASIYRIVRPYNGRYFPLFTQGFKVCITFPINDDNRLAVETGDEILVTHCHKYWFYGQKLTVKNDEKIRQKGWFPCQCAVLMVQPTLHYQTTTISDTTNNHGGDDLLNGNDSIYKKDQ